MTTTDTAYGAGIKMKVKVELAWKRVEGGNVLTASFWRSGMTKNNKGQGQGVYKRGRGWQDKN